MPLLQEAVAQHRFEKHLQLLDGLRVVVSLKLHIVFDTKCEAFDLYWSTFQALYKRRFSDMVPSKVGYCQPYQVYCSRLFN